MTPEPLHQLARRLRDLGPDLQAMPASERCRSLTDALACLGDADHPLGRRAREVLPPAVGLSPAMVDWALRTSVEPWLETGPRGQTALEVLLEQASPETDAIPVPPAFTVLILAGNVFTAALRPLLLGLAIGTPILVKLPGGQDVETSLPGLFRDALLHVVPPAQGDHIGAPLQRKNPLLRRAGGGAPLPSAGEGTGVRDPAQGDHIGSPLRQRSEGLGAALAITNLPSSDSTFEALLVGDPDTSPDLVVAYGDDSTMETLRRRVPATTRLLEHGHGASAAWLPSSALTPSHIESTARALALDVAAYDQRGCLSPIVAWVEAGSSNLNDASPTDFAAHLHRALRDLATQLPPGPIDTATGAARAQWRGTAAVVGRLFESDDSAVVCVDDPSLLPPSPLHRHLAVAPCADAEDLGRQLRPWGVHLKCLGVGSGAGELARSAAAVSPSLPPPLAPRVCALGHMQLPPASWHAEGRRPLEGWLRWRTA